MELSFCVPDKLTADAGAQAPGPQSEEGGGGGHPLPCEEAAAGAQCPRVDEGSTIFLGDPSYRPHREVGFVSC